MPQEEVAVHPNSKRHATCSDSQLPKRMKLTGNNLLFVTIRRVHNPSFNYK